MRTAAPSADPEISGKDDAHVHTRDDARGAREREREHGHVPQHTLQPELLKYAAQLAP